MARMSEKTQVPLELPVVDEAPPVRADAERNREKVLCAAARRERLDGRDRRGRRRR
jgi:hypothetical protein